ncbi:MAG: hypothetical protein QXS54_00445 [Candidatus Methanomethylicaceae archaeon]
MERKGSSLDEILASENDLVEIDPLDIGKVSPSRCSSCGDFFAAIYSYGADGDHVMLVQENAKRCGPCLGHAPHFYYRNGGIHHIDHVIRLHSGYREHLVKILRYLGSESEDLPSGAMLAKYVYQCVSCKEMVLSLPLVNFSTSSSLCYVCGGYAFAHLMQRPGLYASGTFVAPNAIRWLGQIWNYVGAFSVNVLIIAYAVPGIDDDG